MLFLPPDVAGAAPSGALGRRSTTRREPLVDGTADVGAVATQFFLLGIDPYPRKPGAVFSGPAEDRAADSPFASLARLKGSDGKH